MSMAKVSWRCEKDHKCEASWNYCAFCGEPYAPPEPYRCPVCGGEMYDTRHVSEGLSETRFKYECGDCGLATGTQETQAEALADVQKLCGTGKHARFTCSGCGETIENDDGYHMRYYCNGCEEDLPYLQNTPKAKDLPSPPPYTQEEIDEADPYDAMPKVVVRMTPAKLDGGSVEGALRVMDWAK